MEVQSVESFIPGLELNQLYYNEVVGPILAAEFPELAYSSALIGYGSDVLGYSTNFTAPDLTDNGIRRQEPLPPEEDTNPRLYFGRPYQVIFADRFATLLTAAIHDPDLLRIATISSLVGGVDQWVDSTDLLQLAALCRLAGNSLCNERITG
jgi:hypothetical protein